MANRFSRSANQVLNRNFFRVPLLSPEQMVEVDRVTIDELGISPVSLMENVATSMWNEFLAYTANVGVSPNPDDTFLFLCGTGNNGGDGLVLAFLAYQNGFHNITLLLSKESGAELFNLQLKRCNQLGMKCSLLTDYLNNLDGFKGLLRDSCWKFDGLLGTGCNRPFSDEMLAIMNVWNQSGWGRFAVDIPSGCASGGEPFFEANVTLTVQFPKTVFFREENRRGCGAILLCDAGFPPQKAELFWVPSSNFLLESPSSTGAYKNNRGRVTAIVGSMEYPGVACLVGDTLSHLVGFVRLVVPKKIRLSLLMKISSVVVYSYSLALVKKIISISDIITLGSGWSGVTTHLSLLHQLLRSEIPLVMDGGALRLLAQSSSLQKTLSSRDETAVPLCLTPHTGEFKALCQAFFPKSNPAQELLVPLAKKLQSIIVLKGSVTQVAMPNGESYIIDSCRAHLATAGTGDLLAALIPALFVAFKNQSKGETKISDHELLAQSAIFGVQIHGEAADSAYSEQGWISAANIIPYFSQILAQKMPSLQVDGIPFPFLRKNDGDRS